MSLPDRFDTSLIWEWHDGSFDRVDIRPGDGGWDIIGRHGDTRYVLGLDMDWTCRACEVSAGDGTLALRRDAGGWRNRDAGIIPGSEGVKDLDLGWSAITNSFPIRRLMRAGLDRGSFDVLMLGLPDLAPAVVRQSYRRSGEGWHYRNHASGFSAHLAVDKDGLVTDYPGLCSQKDLSA